MGNVLSQDEVDSLLGGITDGKVETEAETPVEEGAFEPYDFTAQAGPVRKKMPAIAVINDRFASFFKTSLLSITGNGVDVDPVGIESLKFGEFCRALPLPASLNIFRIEPLRGFGMLVIEGPLVFSFIDTLFGGKGVSHVKVEGRGFTSIELKIIEKITRITLDNMEQAWEDVHKVKMVMTRSEMDPQFAAIVPPDEMVISSRFTLDIANASGSIYFCIPFSTIEPIKKKLVFSFNSGSQEVDEAWRTHIERELKKMQFELKCTFGTTRISGEKFLGLKMNDVLRLEQPVGSPVQVSIEGIPKFSAHLGVLNENRAVKIVHRVDKE